MRQKRAKWIKKLVESGDPVLLMAIRNKYGDKTQNMKPEKVYKVAKEMWKSNELKHITGWPKI
jgi:hypothetical protein